MFSPYKRRIVRDDSDNDDDVRAPGTAPRKRPLIRDDSDSDSEDAPLVSLCKRMRRVVVDDEDEEDDVAEQHTQKQPAMEDEHHKSLLSSPIASQQASPSALPYLSAELLLNVLEHVDPSDVLDCRLVSSGFRDAIDGHVLHHHIQRVELIGYLGPKNDPLFTNLNAKDYWDYALIKARFDCLDDRTDGQAVCDP
jgi:hypothetical protein